jgi:hypothetical protein
MLVQPFRLLPLVVFLASQAFVAAQDELIPFGSAFAPTFTFTETYRESVQFSTALNDFVDQTSATLTCRARASMQGLDPGALTNEETLSVSIGNLELELTLGEGTRSFVDGKNVVRWRLDGIDPDTGDVVPNACTVTLRYDATELIVQLTSTNVPDDFSIIAPDEAGTPEQLDKVPLTYELSVGPYGMGEQIVYVSGTSALYDTVVNGEEFTDLADVNLSGELDTVNPNVKITKPQADATVDTSTIEVSGTVTDNYFPALVEVSLNGGPFVSATLEDDGTWQLDVTPVPGTNTLIARAEDESGNADTSALRTFVYTPRSLLTVTAEGNAPGSVSGSFINRLDFRPAQPATSVQADLLIGKQFTLIATPGENALFDHWTSNAPLTPSQAASSRLDFTMTEDLTLTAHFVINPFAPVQGKYSGLLTSGDSGLTGFLIGKVAPEGAFSLKAKLGALTLPIKGRFSLDGHFTRQFVFRGVSYSINLTLNVTGIGARTITGTIVGGGTSVTLTADLSPFEKKTHPVPRELVGTFNFLLPPNPNVTDPDYPISIGFGRVTVSSNGTTKFAGKLADGTPVSGGAPLSAENRWPFFSSLYRGLAGSISGWVTFDRSQVDHDLSGTLNWKKPRNSGNAIHPEGFAGQSDLSGVRSDKFTSRLSLAGSNGSSQLILLSPDKDPFPLNISLPFNLRPGRPTTVNAPPGSPIQSITCKVQAKTGLLSGSLVERGAIRKIQGIVVGSKVNEAGGFVLRNGYSTALRITPTAD